MRKPSKSKISAILIAAGASRRLGRPKQLVPIDGQPLILYIIDQIRSSRVDELLVVLGANADEIEGIIPGNVDILHNPNWSDGMSTSIRAGVEYFSGQSDALMICVVDQYALTIAYINQLLELFDNKSHAVVASKYNNDVTGVPAVFDVSVFNQLLKLKGDRGAGKIIKQISAECPEKIDVLKFENGHLDVDKPEHINEMEKYFNK